MASRWSSDLARTKSAAATRQAVSKQDSSTSHQTIGQIVTGFERLPRRQQSLAHLIVDHPEIVAFGSAREVAARVHVNAATVIRFAQALGYSGFNALQGAVRRAYLHGAGLLAPRDPSTAEGPAGAVGAIREAHLGNIARAYENLGRVDIEAIADRIINARRTFVCADGSPEIIAGLLVRLLRHVGLRGLPYTAAGVDSVIDAQDWNATDVLIVIGLWLTFRAPLEALRRAKRAGVTTIAITGSGGSPLATAADYAIAVPTEGVSLPFSMVATAAVVEALITHIAAKRRDQVAQIEEGLLRQYIESDLLAPSPIATNVAKSIKATNVDKRKKRRL
jgi:DNA-binding MurR/RpiR family transcriptional regulator